MPTYWGDLQKSAVDSELIEAAIARISKLYSSMLAFGTWGMVPKSQTDDSTIDEEIDAKIAAHNADSEAHLGAGQSLQSHKAADIIDHLARSVYRDKLAFDRNQIDEHFSTIDAWIKTANVQLNTIMEMTIETTSVNGNTQQAYINTGDGDENAAQSPQNPVFETRVRFGHSTNQQIYIIQGDMDVPGGFGFKVINSTIYGIYWDDDSVEHTYSLGSISSGSVYILRCELVDNVSLKFYINGVMIYDFGAVSPASTNIYMYYQIKTTESALKRMYIKSFHWDADYTTD